MNICFYTSSVPSAASRLNIGYLISRLPAHNYSFIMVQQPLLPPPSLKESLRQRYARFRYNDGRFDFGDDITLLTARIQQQVADFNFKDFPCYNVSAVNDLATEKALDEIKPDIIIQAGAGILKENVFSKAAVGTINLHHGLAPEIRGIHSTFWCMFYGLKDMIGVTCHLIDAGLDTGAVIAKQALHTTATTYIDTEYENYMMGRDVLIQSINILAKGNLTRVNEGEVRSYYFSNPDNFLYYALKQRQFHALMSIKGRAFTMRSATRVVNAV